MEKKTLKLIIILIKIWIKKNIGFKKILFKLQLISRCRKIYVYKCCKLII